MKAKMIANVGSSVKVPSSIAFPPERRRRRSETANRFAAGGCSFFLGSSTVNLPCKAMVWDLSPSSSIGNCFYLLYGIGKNSTRLELFLVLSLAITLRPADFKRNRSRFSFWRQDEGLASSGGALRRLRQTP